MFEGMIYLSDVISDLAFVFSIITEMQSEYMQHGLGVDYTIMVLEDGFQVKFKPYK